MANSKKTIGLRPIDQPQGNVRVNFYKAVTGAAYYMYAPVKLNASGYVEWAACATTTSGGVILGSITGFLDGDHCPVDEDQSGYVPANPDSVDSNGYINVAVADDPNQLFLIEEDTGGTALTQAAVGAGAGLTLLASSGSTISGIANVVLDRSTVGVSPSTNLQVQLIKKWDKPDNAYGDYCKWVVRINDHQYKRASLSLGAEVI